MSNTQAEPILPVELEDDRRRSARKPQAVQAYIASPTTRDPLDRQEVMAVNLSRHGIAFDHKSPLPLGTYHVIDISLGEQRLRSELRIICCRKLADGNYEIGGEFC